MMLDRDVGESSAGFFSLSAKVCQALLEKASFSKRKSAIADFVDSINSL